MEPILPSTQVVESVAELWGSPLHPVGCPQCKQVFLVAEDFSAGLCPVCCRGYLAVQPALLRPEPPELVVPFQKKIADISTGLMNFEKSVWLRPDDFKTDQLLRRVIPIFMPLWLVDSDVNGDWQAETGFDYQVKSSQESYGSSGWKSRDVIETRVRWEPRLGRIDRHYDNVSALALSDYQVVLRLAGNFDYKKAVAYEPDLVNGSLLWVPDLQPETAWPSVQTNLNHLAGDECQRASKAKHIRNFSIHASYSHPNWTQLLLPLYCTYYQDDSGIAHPILINGQSGRIGGARLASQKKGWRLAGISIGIAILMLLLGLGGFALSPILPFFSILAVGLIFLAFCAGVFSLVPIIWPWQWNRKQQDQKVIIHS